MNDENEKKPEREYCLSLDLDSGEIDILPIGIPTEKVNFGCYIPHQVGTMPEMEKLRSEIIMSRFQRIRNKKIKRHGQT